LELNFQGLHGPPSETKIKHVRLTIQPTGHLGICFFFIFIDWVLSPTHRELRDLPRCGALCLLQKPLHYRGIQQNFPPGQTANLVIWWMPAACAAPLLSEISCFYRNLKSGPIPSTYCHWPFGGVAGRAGAMLAIAPRSPPHVCPGRAAGGSRRSMNTASKLGPHTQTDRGTCPGVGL
jgi:hypothetical protein